MAVRVLMGDLFESKAQTLVNTVNCVGVMGRGIALGFRKRFPEMFADYVDRCEAGEMVLGRPYLFRYLLPPWILNFPTKDHWRSVARLADITQGLHHLEVNYRTWGIESMAVPPLGCGEGQLEWRVVGPELYRRLARLGIPVDLYAPFGTPDVELEERFLTGETWAAGGGAAAGRRVPVEWLGLVAVIGSIHDRDPVHPLGRIALQKVAYFSMVAGIPLGIDFERGSYGPFAPALKRILTALTNNGLVAESRMGRMLATVPGATYRDGVRSFDSRDVPWRSGVAEVVNLVFGLDSRAIEVLATVLYVHREFARGSASPSRLGITAEVLAWKQRRRPPFSENEVDVSLERLGVGGWLDR
jgi:O-acetyl-ADP-ribose deacetylase (regulator of RNase III)/uncharacterized protein YwgA